MKVLLISLYDIGRQPFALAEAAATLSHAGFEVQSVDLSIHSLDEVELEGVDMVGLYLGMHTATRLALKVLPRIRARAPAARICAFGLYAPMNRELLNQHGVHAVFGGEYEPALLQYATDVETGDPKSVFSVQLDKIDFHVPLRDGLPSLDQYARLSLQDGSQRIVGFTETTRGCKHLCRHCPVVPVYQGRFRTVPVDVVLADIHQQVEMGAQHISFGDPDFLNGPGHALRIVRAVHERYPGLSYDATTKVEHILQHADLLPELARTGCLFVTSAVESFDDAVLSRLQKGHTRLDVYQSVALLRDAGIALTPTFVPFTPWATVQSYLDMLQTLVKLEMVESVAPVQLSIRLLIPAGSRLLELEELRSYIGPFDADALGYRWQNTDARVEGLYEQVRGIVMEAESEGHSRRQVFERIWHLTHTLAGCDSAPLAGVRLGQRVPSLSESWYCCAEPSDRQLQQI